MAEQVTVFFASDGAGWFQYFESWITSEFSNLSVASLNLEEEFDWNSPKSDFLIIILSPGLQEIVHARGSEFHQLHKEVAAPCRTFGLYLGIEEQMISNLGWNRFKKWTFSILSSDRDVLDETEANLKTFIENPKPVRTKRPETTPKPVVSKPDATEEEPTVDTAVPDHSQTTLDEPDDEKPATDDTSVRQKAKNLAAMFGGKAPVMPGFKPPNTKRRTSVNLQDDESGNESPGSPLSPRKPEETTKPADRRVVQPRKFPPKPLLVKPAVKLGSETENKDEKTSEDHDTIANSSPDPSSSSCPEPSSEPVMHVKPSSHVSKPRKAPMPPRKPDPVVADRSPDPPNYPAPPEVSVDAATGAETGKGQEEVRIIPGKVQHKDEIFILLAKPSTESQLNVQIGNRKKGQKGGKIAHRLNDYTYSFIFDCVDVSPGDLHIRVFAKKERIGSQKIKYQSNCDMISDILPTLANPVEMLCGMLNLDSSNREALDKSFARSYYENSPRQTGPFYNFLLEDIAEKSDKELPTLLHLAAKYGLLEFAKLLITFSSAQRAYWMDNCNGDTPKVIAEKEGNAALVKFFENYEIAIMDYEAQQIYEDMFAEQGTNTNSGLAEEDIYLSMDECYRSTYPVSNVGMGNYDVFVGKDGTRKKFELVMEPDPDEGPELREPVDEFGGQSDSDSEGYLDMEGIKDDIVPPPVEPVRPPVARKLPPRPPGASGGAPRAFPSSAKSFLDVQVEEENPYVSQSESMAELVRIQEECKKGMFNQEETLKRFAHWRERFAEGSTTKSVKTRMGKLQQIRAHFAQKRDKDIVVTHIANQPAGKRKEERAPATLPRVDLAQPSIRMPKPNQTPRCDSSRSTSTISSGSRTSNLSFGGDSGHGGDVVEEEIYDDFEQPSNTLNSSMSSHSRGLMPLPEAPPVPPRGFNAPLRPLPETPGNTPWRNDEEADIKNLGAPPLPPKNY